MKILVTGGTGYIGTALCAALKKHDVWTLGINGDGPHNIIKDIRDEDLDLDGFDVIFHLAAISLPRSVEDDRKIAWDVNVNGTINIAKRLKEHQLLVFASSAHVYDKRIKTPHMEDEAPFPNNFYGLTKLVGEEAIRFFSFQRNFKHVIFRLFNVYSADQGPGLLVGDVFQKYRQEKEIEIVNPDSVLDMVHLDDAVQVLAGSVSFATGTYNLCSGHRTTVRSVYGAIAESVGTKGKKERIVSDKKDALLGDNSKTSKMGFKFRKFSLK